MISPIFVSVAAHVSIPILTEFIVLLSWLPCPPELWVLHQLINVLELMRTYRISCIVAIYILTAPPTTNETF